MYTVLNRFAHFMGLAEGLYEVRSLIVILVLSGASNTVWYMVTIYYMSDNSNLINHISIYKTVGLHFLSK